MKLLSKIFSLILIITIGLVVITLTTFLGGLVTGKDSGGLFYMILPVIVGFVVMIILSIKIFKPKR
jgi:uncharacterized membrane protein